MMVQEVGESATSGGARHVRENPNLLTRFLSDSAPATTIHDAFTAAVFPASTAFANSDIQACSRATLAGLPNLLRLFKWMFSGNGYISWWVFGGGFAAGDQGSSAASGEEGTGLPLALARNCHTQVSTCLGPSGFLDFEDDALAEGSALIVRLVKTFSTSERPTRSGRTRVLRWLEDGISASLRSCARQERTHIMDGIGWPALGGSGGSFRS